MLGRRFISLFKNSSKSQLPSSAKAVEEEKTKSYGYGRKAVSFILITVTGGVALSALDDLAIYRSCSSKALEKVSNSQEIKDALGEPIVKGPWYNASLAVAQKRQSVSCTFPVSGPQGTGVLQLKAVRNGEDTWFSFLRPRDWDIIIMDALLHVPGNDEKNQTFRISVSDYFPPPSCTACTDCKPREVDNQDKK
ncbi:Cytochrome oxidase assembly protein [Trema orientale]|uniref:Cytochrome oxidase assembly protein n=1 Tax=Trema orientale TaxID=63057 RepID=A0A2P5FTT6_TREOI|nr:Cytochrome oxidase assembly protein [Trema orientale]